MAPTVRSSFADFDPLLLIGRFPDAYPGLFESSASLPDTSIGASAGVGPFDILPIASGERLVLDAQRRLSGPFADESGFLAALEQWWQALRTEAAPSALPFTGGWLLYLSYELAAEIEPRLSLPPSGDPIIAFALRTPAAWVHDRSSGQSWLTAEFGREGTRRACDADRSRTQRPRACLQACASAAPE